jgi:class 3 adenylate cyclase/tetratricopeptide (TPR) repeat protein
MTEHDPAVDRPTVSGELPSGTLTFLFTDIEGSTALWDTYPDAMSHALNRHERLVTEVVAENRGQTIQERGEGDSTLSVFPRAIDAVHASIALQVALNTEPWPGGLELPTRMALHTGEVELRDGDYYGGALNRAARIRSLAAGGQVLCSRATHDLVADVLSDDVDLVEVGTRDLKGLQRGETIYALGHPQLPAVAPLPPAPTPASDLFVGRSRELEELTGALASATVGRGRVVLVGGEPGVGKTRLLEELAIVADDHNAQVLWGRCHEEEGTPAFWPWVRILEGYAAHCPTSTLRAQLGAGAAYLTNLVPEFAARLSGIPPPPDLEPKEARFRQFESVARFLRAAARTQSLVLLLEDLQWADASTLMLLQFVGHEIEPASLLIVGTYRDTELSRYHPLADTLADLARHPTTRRLTLDGLRGDDVAAFIAHQIGRPPEPRLVDAVLRQTEGNPFFVSEIVRLVAAEGRLADADKTIAGIPEGIREVIGRRLNRLPPTTNDLLTLASVIGRDFELRALEDLTDSSLDDVHGAIEDACAAHLLRETPGLWISYRFEHELIRQTLYQELGATQRLRLHQQVAQTLEGFYAEELETHLAELAHHFAEASRLAPTSKAVEYSRRAADSALSVLAYEDAAHHYERALGSLDRIAQHEERVRAALLVSLGDAQARAGRLASARQTFREAATVARRLGAVEALAEAANGFAALSPTTAVDEDAVELLESALRVLPGGNHTLRARVMARLAISLYLSGEDERLDQLSSEALAIARRVDEPLLLAEALSCRHGCIRGPGIMPARLDIATEMISRAARAGSVEHQVQGRALRMFDLLSLGDMSAVDVAMDQLGQLIEEMQGRWAGTPFAQWPPRIRATRALLDGDLAQAEQLALECLVISQEHQDPDALQLYGIQLADIRREQDRAAEVVPGIRSLSEQFPEIATWRCGLVALLAEQGKLTEAREILDGLASHNFEMLPSDDFRQVNLVLLADACVLLDHQKHAPTLLELVRPYADENVVLGPAIDCYGSAARPVGALATMLDRFDEADSYLHQALEFNRRLRSRRWVAHTQVDLARMLCRRGRDGDNRAASELLEAAQRTAAELGLALISRQASSLKASGS